MEPDFWHHCWQQNQLGFQLSEPHSLLQQFLPSLLQQQAASCQQIVLPLCGKSPDLIFCSQFLPVCGFELSAVACQAFFAENQLAVQARSLATPSGSFTLYQSSQIEIWQGDFFQVPLKAINQTALIYDRAALIALPSQMRKAYAAKLLDWIKQGAKLLLISLEYPQAERKGPPFSVSAEEIQQLFPGVNRVLLASQDITGKGFGRRKMATGYLVETIWLLSQEP